jgi:DNA repair protein SbcD/Mre11
MKILHTSDLHIGKALHERDLLPDQAHMLIQLEKAVREFDPAALVISGDIYDRSIPSPEAVDLFGDFLGRVKAGRPDITVLIIPGNHDSPARLGFGDSLFRIADVHVRVRPEDVTVPIVVERGGEKLYLWALPFLGPGAFPEAPHSQAGQFEEAMRRTVPLLPADGANVLVCHAFALGGQGSDSERTFLGTAELVDAALFEAFDYVALGHLHKPQKAGKNGLYPGSPLAYSFSEAGQTKGFVLADVSKGGVKTKVVPVEPLHPLSRLDGTYSSFLEGGAARAERNDYLEVLLTDSDPVLSPAETLRRVFPNLLSVRQRAFEARAEASDEEAAAALSLWTQQGSFQGPARDCVAAALEDFVSFHRVVKGEEPDAAILTLFGELLKEAVDAAS